MRPGEAGAGAPGAMRPVENDDIASFPFERRHATPQGSVERRPGKAYIRMGIVLGTEKGRDLIERLLPRQRGAIMTLRGGA